MRTCDVLSALVGTPADEFLTSYLGKSFLLSRADEFADGLPVTQYASGIMDQLMSGALRASSVRVVRNGADYSGSLGSCAPGDQPSAEPYVNANVLARLLADGHTLVARSIHRFCDPVRRLTTDLGYELGCPVRATAYLTPPDRQGLKPHYDAHDVFIVQLSGSKRWQLSEPPLKLPVRSCAWHRLSAATREEFAARATPVADLELAVGDVLYLPRGYLHSARACDSLSMHMTISVHPVTRADLALVLASLAEDRDWFREMIDTARLASDDDLARHELGDVLAALGDMVRGLSPQQIVWAARKASREEPIAWPVDIQQQALAINDATAFDNYAKTGKLVWSIQPGESVSCLRTDIADVRFASTLAELVQHVMNATVIDLGALRESHPEEHVLGLLKSLLQAGIIRPVAGEER